MVVIVGCDADERAGSYNDSVLAQDLSGAGRNQSRNFVFIDACFSDPTGRGCADHGPLPLRIDLGTPGRSGERGRNDHLHAQVLRLRQFDDTQRGLDQPVPHRRAPSIPGVQRGPRKIVPAVARHIRSQLSPSWRCPLFFRAHGTTRRVQHRRAPQRPNPVEHVYDGRLAVEKQPTEWRHQQPATNLR